MRWVLPSSCEQRSALCVATLPRSLACCSFLVATRSLVPGVVQDHVLRMHRYCRPGSEGLPVPLDASAKDEAREEDKAG